jgi:hypothetical protein
VLGILMPKSLFERLGEEFGDFGDVCPSGLSELLAPPA